MNRATLPVLLLVLITLAGCGDPAHPDALVGHWKLDPAQGNLAHQMLLFPAAERKQFATFTAPTLMLELDADGKATFAGAPGTWSADGRELHVLRNKPAGEATQPGELIFRYSAREQVFHYGLEEDGKALRTVNNGLELVWRKQ